MQNHQGNNEIAIKIFGLKKAYGQVEALRGLNLVVQKGTILALVGPNGAGKTTLVRILATLLEPSAGRALIGGLDVVHHAQRVRRLIGLTGQYAAVDEILTGRENIELVGRLYHFPKPDAKNRATELIRKLNLEEIADRKVKTYSGGQRRRLDLAASLVVKPQILFLDEPTTGLDPRSRLELWAVIRDLVTDGTTILLTTQYLEEADRLADWVAIIDKGHLIAEGTASDLKNQIGGAVLELHISDPNKASNIAESISDLGQEQAKINQDTGKITLPLRGGAEILPEVIRRIDSFGVGIIDIAMHRPTLDDVFLNLTGHATDQNNSFNKKNEFSLDNY